MKHIIKGNLKTSDRIKLTYNGKDAEMSLADFVMSPALFGPGPSKGYREFIADLSIYQGEVVDIFIERILVDDFGDVTVSLIGGDDSIEISIPSVEVADIPKFVNLTPRVFFTERDGQGTDTAIFIAGDMMESDGGISVVMMKTGLINSVGLLTHDITALIDLGTQVNHLKLSFRVYD